MHDPTGAPTTIEDDQAVSIQVTRPENNIAFAVITINDYESKNYVNVFDLFDNVTISFRYGSDAWTEVFDGMVSTISPRLSNQGEVLEIALWGMGWALIKTHCDTSYGRESDNPTLAYVQDILQDLLTNHINLSFADGAENTHWGLVDETETVWEAVATRFRITSLESPYLDNFTLVNRICALGNAHARGLSTPEVSLHWFVDTSKNLRVKKIDTDHTDGNWDHYWGGTTGVDPGTQVSSTIQVTRDMILYDFRKNIEEYANKVLLACTFRKPASDIWSEDGGPTWGTYDATATYDNAQFVVGSHSLLLEPTNSPAMGTIYYPGSTLLTGNAAAGQPVVAVTSIADLEVGDEVTVWDNTPTTERATILSIAGLNLTMTVNLTNAYQVADAAYVRRNAHWDFTACSSQNTIPTFNFYVHANNALAFAYPVLLCTDRIPLVGGAATDYFETTLDEYINPVANKWVHISLPIGPHYAIDPSKQLHDGTDEFEWNVVNNADWAEINFICLDLTGNNAWDKWFDDIHFAGKLVREAYDASEITATQKEHQKILRLDTAVDDSLHATVDTGTAARLCYAELLRRVQTPRVALIKIPGAETILPGQTMHVHAGLKKGFNLADTTPFRIDDDFRVKELKHVFNSQGFQTVLNLTDDVTNSHAVGVPTAYSLLKEYAGALAHSEAKDLKASGMDRLLTRLSKSY